MALLAGAAPLKNRRWLVALVVAQLMAGVVGVTLAAPDRPDGAESGRIDLHITSGVLWNDVQCREDDRKRGPWPTATDALAQAEAMVRSEQNFSCQRDSWRAT